MLPETSLKWVPAACYLGVFLTGILSYAQSLPDFSPANPAGQSLAQQELTLLLHKKLPAQSPATIDLARQEFLLHLRDTSPIIAEAFGAGRMNEDDLASRLDIFIGDHPEFMGRVSTSAVDPRQQVVALLENAPDLARTDAERRGLAERFIERLGTLSGTARNELLSGRLSREELQSRVTVFIADERAGNASVAADPAVAAVPPIVDAYIKANLGSASEQMNSICYRGVVEEKGHKRQFVLFKMRPRFFRMHVIENGLVVGVLGFDGSSAWVEYPGRLPVAAVGHEADILTRVSRFDDPLVGYRERGASVRLQDRASDGPILLHIQEPDATELVANIDPATYKETSLRTRRPDGRWNEVRFQDYRKVGNFNVPYVQEEWEDGVRQSTTRYSDVRLDPGLIDRFFARPTTLAFDYMDLMAGVAVMEARAKQAPASSQIKIQ